MADGFLEHVQGHKTYIHESHLVKEIEKWELSNDLDEDSQATFSKEALEKIQLGIDNFNAKKNPSDKMYYFHTGGASFGALAGRAGYVIVRDGKIAHHYIVMMS